MLVIPSTKRANKQVTWSNLSPALQKKTIVIVPRGEESEYRRHLPAITVVGIPVTGIGPTRQWVLKNAKRLDGRGKVIMLDDDLKFDTRRMDDPTKFTPATAADVEAMVAEVYRQLNRHVHASIAVRQGGNRNTEPLLYNTRMLRVLAYDAPKVLKAGVDFARLEVMEDFDVTLTLLRQGLSCVSINRWVQDQVCSNAPGGCSGYRTYEMQARAAEELSRLHAPFVTVVEKKTAAWGNFGGGMRKDVRIQWKRAYQSSQVEG